MAFAMIFLLVRIKFTMFRLLLFVIHILRLLLLILQGIGVLLLFISGTYLAECIACKIIMNFIEIIHYQHLLRCCSRRPDSSPIKVFKKWVCFFDTLAKTKIDIVVIWLFTKAFFICEGVLKHNIVIFKIVMVIIEIEKIIICFWFVLSSVLFRFH